ncbi:MAG: hypothetical protein KDC09_02625 [Bacteroidales bacterium]|nr:hypothetical protein [Bacteroidales bacterium]
MKRTFLISLLGALLFLSCNRDKDCNDLYTLNEVRIFNSNIDESSDIHIYSYAQGSDFTQLVDSSIYIMSFQQVDSIYSLEYIGYLNKNIRTDLDYEFVFNTTNERCRITSINVRKDLCYKNLFHKEYEYSFDGYYVNGEKFACQVITIFPNK